VNALKQDGTLGALINDGKVIPYRPMPPLIDDPLPDGRHRRVLAVGLRPKDGASRHEIVGVHLGTGQVARFDSGAPPHSLAQATMCGAPDANQPTVSRNTAGSYRVSVAQAGQEIWGMTVIRPATSSGTRGSGIELRDVRYKSKLVLYQAHVPILNVRYDGDRCGPYRDWQWQEGMFSALGTDVAPGFRQCTAKPMTVLGNGNDNGNFAGVAIHQEGNETVLVSELEAGWYRYISQWRFDANGTIRPRFGFTAVQNSCVCNLHHHHVYWRLDFDIDEAAHNAIKEFNNPPTPGAPQWSDIVAETRRAKNPTSARRWRIGSLQTGTAYDLVPGSHDGALDSWGVGDLWVLRYRGAEIDDGYDITTGVEGLAQIDRFVNGEAVRNQDIVVWYGAHFTHDISDTGGHIVGPDLIPASW
jgi:hypothetical protein